VAISTATYFVPRLLGEFAQLHPGVKASLRVTNREQVLETLAAGLEDLYILGQPPEGLAVTAIPFMDNPLVVLAAPDHPLAHKKHISLARLAEEPWLLREPGSGTRKAVERLFAENGSDPLATHGTGQQRGHQTGSFSPAWASRFFPATPWPCTIRPSSPYSTCKASPSCASGTRSIPPGASARWWHVPSWISCFLTEPFMTSSNPKPKNALRPTGKRPAPAAAQAPTQAATLDLAPTIEALGLVLEMDRPADVKLSGFFRNYPKLGSRDRAFIAEAVYGVLRHLRSLQVLAAPPTPRRLLLAWLARHGGRNLREFEALAHKDDLEWLRGLKGAKLDDQPEAVRLDLPDWLHERLRAQYGDHLPT
jgi:hypothetical protein